MEVDLRFCYDGKKRRVCLRVGFREGKMAGWKWWWECGRWLWGVRTSLTGICDIPVRDSFMSWERQGERFTDNSHWALWGSSWWGLQWPKGRLFRPGLGVSHRPAFIPGSGWRSVCPCSVTCNTVLPNQPVFQKGNRESALMEKMYMCDGRQWR